MRNHHLRSLRNFPFRSAVMNTSDPPGTTAQPASPACAQSNPVNTGSCQRPGPSPAAPTHPPLGVCLGFCRDFFLQNFCLEEREQGEGRILDRGLAGGSGSAWAAGPRYCQLRAKESWDCPCPLLLLNLSPVSAMCFFAMDLKQSSFTPATDPTLEIFKNLPHGSPVMQIILFLIKQMPQ